MAAKILIVEDEPGLLTALRYSLVREGYEVHTATDGEQALAVARAQHPDLLLLDVMLPRLDGFEVCRILRRESSVPILMLTARDEEIDRVVGLELGADDYVTKPFSMRELVARVKAMLRRVEMVRHEARAGGDGEGFERLVTGDLEIDSAQHRAVLKGQPLALKPKEFDLLAFLVRNRGRAFSRDTILERVWGYDFAGETKTVDVHVRWLREKIESDPSHPRRLETVRGVGYRFVE